MKSPKAYTLIELLVGFMIGTVMILMIGTVLSIGTMSHKKVRDEGAIFNDVSYAFRFLRNRVRESSLINYDTSPGSVSWEGPRLIVGDQDAQGVFGVLVTNNERIFIYAADKNDLNNKDILMKVPKQQDNNLSFYFTQMDNHIRVYLMGKRDKIPFSFSSSIRKRIQ